MILVFVGLEKSFKCTGLYRITWGMSQKGEKGCSETWGLPQEEKDPMKSCYKMLLVIGGENQKKRLSWTARLRHFEKEEWGSVVPDAFNFSELHHSLTSAWIWRCIEWQHRLPRLRFIVLFFSLRKEKNHDTSLFICLNNAWADISLNYKQWAEGMVSIVRRCGLVEFTKAKLTFTQIFNCLSSFEKLQSRWHSSLYFQIEFK